MTRNADSTRLSRKLIIGWVAMAAACAQNASGPSNLEEARSSSGQLMSARQNMVIPNGVVQASATGDVKSGTGDLEIFNVRMDRQTSSGTSIVRQYANPGGEYAIKAGETIELWAEYRGANNPRLIANWGDGTTDFINCGSCLMKHTYAQDGRFPVKVILDDRVSTTVTRTFVLYTVTESRFLGVLAGSFTDDAGPNWHTNPPVLSCVEACAQLFGGSSADYQCSTTSGSITRTAFLTEWGVGGCPTYPDTFKKGGPGYNCGSSGCSASAYVNDNCSGSPNYCFH